MLDKSNIFRKILIKRRWYKQKFFWQRIESEVEKCMRRDHFANYHAKNRISSYFGPQVKVVCVCWEGRRWSHSYPSNEFYIKNLLKRSYVKKHQVYVWRCWSHCCFLLRRNSAFHFRFLKLNSPSFSHGVFWECIIWKQLELGLNALLNPFWVTVSILLSVECPLFVTP